MKIDLNTRLNLVVLRYFWDRRSNEPEWSWLRDTLGITDRELLELFRYKGFKEEPKC